MYPFSNGKAVASYLSNVKEQKPIIVGTEDFAVSTVAGYLDYPIYYPERQSLGTFMIWNKSRNHEVNHQIIEQTINKLMNESRLTQSYFITNKLDSFAFKTIKVIEKKTFPKALQKDENLVVYTLEKR